LEADKKDVVLLEEAALPQEHRGDHQWDGLRDQ
jgi:hypothetical protein